MNLITLTAQNLLSYEDLELDFSSLGHSLFVGKNGCGKTSIFDILCLVLYGQTPRKRYKRIIRDVPRQQKNGVGVVIFKQGQDEYKITRIIGLNESLKVECNGSEVELRTKTLIQTEVDKIIGMDFKTFLNVAYFVQGDVGKFLNSTSTERIEVISNILNFDDVNKIIKETDKQISIIEIEINESQGRMKALEEATSGESGAELSKKKKVLIKRNNELRLEMAEIENYIFKCSLKEQLIKKRDDLVNSFQTNKQTTSQLITQNKQQIEYLSNKEWDVKGITDKIESLSEKLSILESTNNRLEVIEDEIEEMNGKISDIEGDRKFKKMTLLPSLENIIGMEGKTCPTCKQLVSEDSVEDIKKSISVIKSDINKMTEKILKYRSDLEIRKTEKSNLEDEKKVLNKVKSEKEKLSFELEQMSKDGVRIESLKKTNNKMVEDLKVKLSETKNKINAIKTELSLYDVFDLERAKSLEISFDDKNEEVSNNEVRINNFDYEINRYSEAIKKLNATKKLLDSYKDDYEMKSYWKKTLPKVKIRMISDVIPFLESESNKYLGQILSGHYMTFEADPNKKQNKLDIDIEDTINKVKRPIEGWSGGERDKMSLAVYLALNKLASLRSGKEINFIVLDEKLIFIDTESRPLVFDMLKNEYSDRKIWMISHLQDISTEFDQIIKVKKTGGVSGIEISKN